MSRIGKKPIEVPEDVTVTIAMITSLQLKDLKANLQTHLTRILKSSKKTT